MMAGESAEVIWRAHPGSQSLFLTCPFFECLYHGTRGGGKTDALLFDFAQSIDRGFGDAWRGILFRKSYPQLEEVVTKSRRWFHRIFPDATFTDYAWKWPTGEKLYFRHMEREADYWKYHGHEYPWIGFEELTGWVSLNCYHSMKSCCRSSHPGMPRKIRSTCNPWGPGHNQVKSYFIDVAPPGVPYRDEKTGESRVHIPGYLFENVDLMSADPGYQNRLMGAADSNEKRKAWLEGNWDIVAGGMFDDIWNRNIHVIKPFLIPAGWHVNRSFDWGASKPFSVGWWAESDGTFAPNGRIYPKGTLFRIDEWYGWTREPDEGLRMNANEIAEGIRKREEELRKTILARHSGVIKPGPADPSIFDDSAGDGIARQMEQCGIKWTVGNNASRINRWQVFRVYLKEATRIPMEKPGLFTFDTCTDGFIRCIPVMQRDEKKLDDIDTDTEDHVADEAGYRIMENRPRTTYRRFL